MICVEEWLVVDSAMLCFVYKFLKIAQPQIPGARRIPAGSSGGLRFPGPLKQDDIMMSRA